VLLDGKPIPARYEGSDVHGGVVTVRQQRLYTLVSLPNDQQHRLALRFAPGVSATRSHSGSTARAAPPYRRRRARAYFFFLCLPATQVWNVRMSAYVCPFEDFVMSETTNVPSAARRGSLWSRRCRSCPS